MSAREEAFYAPSQRLADVTFTFPETVTFDCFRVDEVIELGHRINGFALDVLCDGVWSTLLERKCIGFCYADRFPPVSAQAVRLRITSADADPVLRFFGLYCGAWSGETQAQQRGERTGLLVEPTENGVTVDFGGIFPFDCVLWEGAEYALYAFNGASYDYVTEGSGLLRCLDVAK